MSKLQFTAALPLTLLLSVFVASVRAQNARPPESEARQPYKLVVVLHLADNPALTDTFYDRVARELGDSLQADFGDLVEVQVVRKHPWLNDVLGKGLASALKSSWTVRDGVKTHFVLIDFNGVDYEIQTGQYDGITGQPNPVLVVEKERTPVIRKESTRDREFVAKTTAQMIERDFGLIASFSTWPRGPQPQTVQLEFKGASLVPLDRWVKKGDVFAVVKMPNGNGASEPVTNAIVQVQDAPKEGVASGQLFWRFQPPVGPVNFRCVKLGAVSGPLRLRLIKSSTTKKDTVEPVDASLEIRRLGFTGELQTFLKAATRHGLFDGSGENPKDRGVFDKVAFVSVVGNMRAVVAVPLLTDQPYLIKLTDQNEADQFAEIDKEAWHTKVRESFGRLEYVISDIQKLATKDGTVAEIVKKGENGLDVAQEAYDQLIIDRQLYYKKPTAAEERDLKAMDTYLNKMKIRIGELKVFVDQQKKIETEEKDPERLKWRAKIEQGKLFEKELDYGKAITLYQSLPKQFETPELTNRVKELQLLWDTKDEPFREARSFIYDVFPNLKGSNNIQIRLPEAEKALKECKRLDNKVAKVAAQKLLMGTEVLLPQLEEEAKPLNSRINVEDEPAVKRIQDVLTRLKSLHDDAQVFLGIAEGSR
jgi:hypothetical protein